MNETDPVSDDQATIRDYLASSRFRRASRRGHRLRRSLMLSVDSSFTPRVSLIGGAVAMGIFLSMLSAAMVLMIWAINEFAFQPREFVPMALVIQTVGLPVMIAISLVTATAMFWYRSILLRTILGLAMIVPAFLVFVLGMWWSEGSMPDRALYQTIACVFAQFLSCGAISLGVQLFTRWTLSARRAPDAPPIAPTNLFALFELTIFFAITFAIVIANKREELISGFIFFLVWGVLSTPAVIGVMVASLRQDTAESNPGAPSPSSKRGWIIAGTFCWACAAMVTGFFAAEMFSFSESMRNIPLIAMASLYGAFIMLVPLFVGTWILRAFGWQCLHRGTGTTASLG